MSGAEDRAEARRILGICDACGYCNGLCDLFEAARRRPALADTDLTHLANLCHGCRSCLYACQYAPPHVFAVNVPRTLAEVRQRSYVEHTWPRAMAVFMEHGRTTALLIGLGAVALMVGLVLLRVPPEVLFATHPEPGAFYRILPWGDMLLLGLLPLGWSALAVSMSLRSYWRATRRTAARITPSSLARMLRDILIMRNLSGGGPGCNDLDERPSQRRRWLHQTLVLGVLLSFAATLSASAYHHLLALEAPYPLFSPPVLLGTLGGVAMVIGAGGLLWLHRREDPLPTATKARRADAALLILLLAVALTGLGLLLLRGTAAMGLLLAIHLGTVLGLFLLLPYTKLMHAGYRAIALLIEAMEHRGSRRP